MVLWYEKWQDRMNVNHEFGRMWMELPNFMVTVGTCVWQDWDNHEPAQHSISSARIWTRYLLVTNHKTGIYHYATPLSWVSYYTTNIVGITHNCILGAAEFCVDLKTNVNTFKHFTVITWLVSWTFLCSEGHLLEICSFQ